MINRMEGKTVTDASLWLTFAYGFWQDSVADPHHIDADPAFHFEADPTFHFDADPESPFNLMRIRILPLAFFQIWNLQCSIADPDPTFHFDADQDPCSASQHDADPDSQHCGAGD
jgi:hypothetical protein